MRLPVQAPNRGKCPAGGARQGNDEKLTGGGAFVILSADGPGTWFASQLFGITPDIMAIGKSFGGGYPVTAVVTTQEISSSMRGGYDGSTFGGNPMAMTAALIATRQMKTLGLPALSHARGEQIDSALRALALPKVKGWRVLGLMVGIDLESPDAVASVQRSMMALGVHSSLSTGATLRWMPPLVITEEQVGKVMQAFASALEEL